MGSFEVNFFSKYDDIVEEIIFFTACIDWDIDFLFLGTSTDEGSTDFSWFWLEI